MNSIHYINNSMFKYKKSIYSRHLKLLYIPHILIPLLF